MTSEEVIEIVDNLCEKMGLAITDASQLIPIYAEYKTFSLITSAGLCFICLIILAALIIRYCIKLKRMGVSFFNMDDSYDDYAEIKCGVLVAGIVAFCIFAVCFIGWVLSAIEWQLFPEAQMINLILNMIK